MNYSSPPTVRQYEKIESNLAQLHARIPNVPVIGVMLSRLLMHLGRDMASMLEQQLRPSDLAEAEFRVLTTLFSQPDGVAHPGELCARTSQSPATMSRITDTLFDRSLITRVASVADRRKLVLRITAQGEELVQRLLPSLFEPLRSLFVDFSDDEQRQLVSQLKRLGTNLEELSSTRSAERPV